MNCTAGTAGRFQAGAADRSSITNTRAALARMRALVRLLPMHPASPVTRMNLTVMLLPRPLRSLPSAVELRPSTGCRVAGASGYSLRHYAGGITRTTYPLRRETVRTHIPSYFPGHP